MVQGAVVGEIRFGGSAREVGDLSGAGTVTVLGVPARLFLESQDHQHDLIREFALIHFGHRPDNATTEAPERLARLIAEVHHTYADVRWVTRLQALQALERGDEEVAMRVPVRPGMAGALRRWLDLLERADRFCEEGALLTLAATPEVRRLRRWYADQLLRLLPAETPGPASLA